MEKAFTIYCQDFYAERKGDSQSSYYTGVLESELNYAIKNMIDFLYERIQKLLLIKAPEKLLSEVERKEVFFKYHKKYNYIAAATSALVQMEDVVFFSYIDNDFEIEIRLAE